VALADLLAALEREAEDACAGELRRATEEAERLRESASREGSVRLEALLAEHGRTLRARGEEKLVAARRRAEARVLEARHELLGRVFDGALALQDEVRGRDAYRDALERDVKSLLALAAGEEEVTLLCHPLDRARVAAAAGRGVRVEGVEEVVAGVRLRAGQGRLTIDRSLAARVGSSRAELAMRVVQQVEAPG